MPRGDNFSEGGYEAEKWEPSSAKSLGASINECRPSFSELWAFDQLTFTGWGECGIHKDAGKSCGIKVSVAFAKAGCPLDFAGGGTCLLADRRTACGMNAEQVYNVVRRRYQGVGKKEADLIKSGTTLDKGYPAATGIIFYKGIEVRHVDLWNGSDLRTASTLAERYYKIFDLIYFFPIP